MLLASPVRLELATFGVGGQHSIQLSYGDIILILWCRRPTSCACRRFGHSVAVFRCALLALACSKATFARRSKTTFRGCFCSSGYPIELLRHNTYFMASEANFLRLSALRSLGCGFSLRVTCVSLLKSNLRPSFKNNIQRLFLFLRLSN